MILIGVIFGEGAGFKPAPTEFFAAVLRDIKLFLLYDFQKRKSEINFKGFFARFRCG